MSRMFLPRELLSLVKIFATLKFTLTAAAALTGVPYASFPVITSPPENLLLLLCVCAVYAQSVYNS